MSQAITVIWVAVIPVIVTGRNLEMTDGLIVKQPYADEIMSGEKVAEYRVKKLPEDKYYVDVYILSGGHILGTVSFDKCDEFKDGFEWHVRKVEKLSRPVRYIHPKGARVWIREVVPHDIQEK